MNSATTTTTATAPDPATKFQSPIAAAAAALARNTLISSPPTPLRQLSTNTNNFDQFNVSGSSSNSGIKMKGASGHLARWKSYNNQRRKQYGPSTKLKRFLLMFSLFK